MKNQASPRADTQSGSIFVWIFLMIALFAALSIAMTQGFRSGASVLTKEKASLAAQEIINYLNYVKDGVTKLRIDGCDPMDINFQNTVNVRNNGTLTETIPPTTRPECYLFASSGAGLTAQNFEQFVDARAPVGAATGWKHGNMGARYVGAQMGTNANDLSIFANAFDENVCLAVISMISKEQASTIPFQNYTSSGSNSYTPGAPGGLSPVTTIAGSSIYAVRRNASDAWCNIGIVLYVQ